MKVITMTPSSDGGETITLELSLDELEHLITAGFSHILNDYLKSEVDPTEVK